MFTIAALYHFTRFDDPTALKGPLAATCCKHGVTGTLLLAHEGINGTIAGTREGIDAALMLLTHELRDRITVERDYGDIPPVRCRPAARSSAPSCVSKS